MKPQVFFARHPVFRYEEFVTSVDSSGTRSANTINALLTHYKRTGKIGCLYLTHREARDYSYRSLFFQSVRFPRKLLKKKREFYGVSDVERNGVAIRVISLERTLVDLLDRPELGGGWEEIWRSLESVEFFDLDLVLEYAQLLGNATTSAKVGYFLEQHGEELMVEGRYLETLSRRRPQKPHYMVRSGRMPGRFFERWNLIVPEQIVDRSWQEVP